LWLPSLSLSFPLALTSCLPDAYLFGWLLFLLLPITFQPSSMHVHVFEYMCMPALLLSLLLLPLQILLPALRYFVFIKFSIYLHTYLHINLYMYSIVCMQLPA